MSSQQSLVWGSTDDVLYKKPVGVLVQEQAKKYGSKTALISSWQGHRATYADLDASSANVAKALQDLNYRRGHNFGIFAGNRYEYIDLFLAGGRIGRPAVVLNSQFSPQELCAALARSGRRHRCQCDFECRLT